MGLKVNTSAQSSVGISSKQSDIFKPWIQRFASSAQMLKHHNEHSERIVGVFIQLTCQGFPKQVFKVKHTNTTYNSHE